MPFFYWNLSEKQRGWIKKFFCLVYCYIIYILYIKLFFVCINLLFLKTDELMLRLLSFFLLVSPTGFIP